MGYRLVFSALPLVVFSGAAIAAPIVVDIDRIAPSVIVDFQDFPEVEFGPLVDLGPVTFRAPQTATKAGIVTCRQTGAQCLLDVSQTLRAERVFEGFEKWVTGFGFDLLAFDIEDNIFATVTGRSGVSSFDLSGGGIFGFSDLEGLTSISIVNKGAPLGGISNYAFDDLIVGKLLDDKAVLAPVPLPPAATLLLCGLAALVLFRKRKPVDLGRFSPSSESAWFPGGLLFRGKKMGMRDRP